MKKIFFLLMVVSTFLLGSINAVAQNNNGGCASVKLHVGAQANPFEPGYGLAAVDILWDVQGGATKMIKITINGDQPVWHQISGRGGLSVDFFNVPSGTKISASVTAYTSPNPGHGNACYTIPGEAIVP